MAQARRYLPRTDDDVALHPMARRHVVAAVLLCAGLVAFFWPTPSGTKPSSESSCEKLDQSPSEAVARLIQNRDEAAEARISDTLRLGHARENCRYGLVGLAENNALPGGRHRSLR